MAVKRYIQHAPGLWTVVGPASQINFRGVWGLLLLQNKKNCPEDEINIEHDATRGGSCRIWRLGRQRELHYVNDRKVRVAE